MNPNPGDHWRGPGGPQQGDAQSQGRPFAGYGPTGPSQPTHLPPPPPAPYHQHHSQPSGSHGLSITDLTQGPPNQHQYNTQPPPQSQPHPMAAMAHPMSQHSPPYVNRERELREIREREIREQELRDREMRERNTLELQRHQEELMIREREARDREMERMRHEQQQPRPVQSHAGSLTIHQPVANKVPNSIHGPNGLLSNGGAGPGPPNGPPVTSATNIFGGQAQHEMPRAPQFIHQQVVPPAQQQAQSFLAGPSPMQSQAQLAHGQQPILNDALSYLDQVKVRFSDQPDVYNRFLDIMKDFKSQAIDTPGVIDRVSNLFNGHPALIQGFNTFLPPGYRIECGTDDNPDAIRVTTPSGTMTQSLQSRARGPYEPAPMGTSSLNRQDTFESRHGWGQPLGTSPDARPKQLSSYDQAAADRAAEENATAMHQQEQRGVANLQNAVSAATNGVTRPALAVSPGPGQVGSYPQQGMMLAGSGAGDFKKGGPVEFNHAISYVNKIKNRFAQQPEIYKQFLEILQTYQRESKPIQDVYAQVTQLFHSAPDLLEDFKQFLPESAAHARAQASARAAAAEESNIRAESGYTPGSLPQAQTPRPAAKMPPMGQFDPPSTSKDNKKRRAPGASATQAASQPALDNVAQSSKTGAVQVGNLSKRQKLTTQRQPQADVAAVSPTLIPQLPEPLPPYPDTRATQEELGFFDRAKKQIGNRASYTEFMKLINLYTQDMIDKYTLVDRVNAFLGGNPDLMTWFKSFLGVEEQDEILEAKARPDPGRVNLSHCRALGPSYRHLPKRDQNKSCKGRDGMCYEVLNDVWASHPTWASEDSGFVAHRKNQYEEALHRIEEERHDYDFHIETCLRTIQLMEPLVQQIGVMSDADRAAFQLAPGLGGPSEAIPKRIVLKIYGREIGARVMTEMFLHPTAVLPIVLSRLKQKLEEWKSVQREWEKVWRDQTHKMYWKSLDHQGINVRNSDKKAFQQKTLISEIQAKYEEGKQLRDRGMPARKHQYEFSFKDVDVIADASRLVLASLLSDRNQYNAGDIIRLKAWFLDFVQRFFGLDRDSFDTKVAIEETINGNDHDERHDGNESDVPSTAKAKIGRKTDQLRRQALERRNAKEDSVASASKESTPMPGAGSDMDMDDPLTPPEANDHPQAPWIQMVTQVEPTRTLSLEESYPHSTYNLYANSNIYCFFRTFEFLCSRLAAVKSLEDVVQEAIARYRGVDGKVKPAIDLHMIDKGPEEFFFDISPKARYYPQILKMCEGVVSGSGDMPLLEETLRRYFNKYGWQLYSLDKLVGTILRFIMNILGGDAKDKSVDITNLFLKDREKPDTTRAQEIQYRKQVERLSKDGEVYRISYTPSDQLCTIRLFPTEDPTFDNDSLSDEARWQYYVASFLMTDATEGIDQSRMRRPFLRRNIAPQNANLDAAYNEVYGNLAHVDTQICDIKRLTYKMILKEHFGFERMNLRPTRSRHERSEPFKEKFIRNTVWMRDQRAEDVESCKAEWERGVRDGFPLIAEDSVMG